MGRITPITIALALVVSEFESLRVLASGNPQTGRFDLVVGGLIAATI
jgi:hypothetical protein